MSETMISQMLDLRRSARLGYCRIKRWKLSEKQACRLIDESAMWLDKSMILEQMKRGEVRMLGAQIVVKP